MKNRTKSRILSLLLSMLMCIWLVQPVPLWAAETEDPSWAVSASETDGAGSETTADDLQILDSTGAPASSGFTKTDDTLTITHNGAYTVVIQGTDCDPGNRTHLKTQHRRGIPGNRHHSEFHRRREYIRTYFPV